MEKDRDNPIAVYVRTTRKKLHLNQETLALYSGVGLRFVRDLEQGKLTLKLDKVIKVLSLLDGQIEITRISGNAKR